MRPPARPGGAESTFGGAEKSGFAAGAAMPPGWPLTDEQIHRMIRDLVQRVRRPPRRLPPGPRARTRAMSRTSARVPGMPSPFRRASLSDVRDIDSNQWKQADEESMNDGDSGQEERPV